MKVKAAVFEQIFWEIPWRLEVLYSYQLAPMIDDQSCLLSHPLSLTIYWALETFLKYHRKAVFTLQSPQNMHFINQLMQSQHASNQHRKLQKQIRSLYMLIVQYFKKA